MAAEIRLHTKLYRATAITEAIRLATSEQPDARFDRRREGDYYVVSEDRLEETSARELLAEIADVTLVITVEQDRRR